jgi:hypothetical protein
MLSSVLSACVTTDQTTDAVKITAQAYIANESIDAAQVVIGQYSVNQDTLKAVDDWQARLETALKDGTAISKMNQFRSEGVVYYEALKSEAVERQSELSATQLSMLNILDSAIVSLDKNITLFIEDENNAELIDSVTELSEVILTAKTILSIYGIAHGI